VQELKETFLHDEHFLALAIDRRRPTKSLIGLTLQEAPIPANSLVALLRREGRVLVPKGRTVLQDGDRITIIGDPAEIRQLELTYQVSGEDH
jgi:Trk K+ transport system NAD-binding subunit